MDIKILFNIFVFLIAACAVVPLASRFKLGSVIGYLVAGIIIGPFGLKLIENPEQIMHFAEFGVVMMLFLIGLELEPKILWRMKKSILGFGGLQVILTSLLMMTVGVFLGYPWNLSLAVGMALTLSSTALVLQMLQEKNLMQTAIGETAFAILLFQDIAVIPILIIIPLITAGDMSNSIKDSTFVGSLAGWQHALLVISVIAAVVIAGRTMSRTIFMAMAKTNLREVFTATSLALIIGITLLMEIIGVSPALGAFVAGVVLANSEYKHTLENDIEPFKGLLLGLFFISVGMGINFGLFANNCLNLTFVVITFILVKVIVLYGLGRIFGLEKMQNLGFALALSQGSEFAFVLLQYISGLKIISEDQLGFFTLAVALSMASTPFLMILYSRLIVPRFMSILPDRKFDKINESNPVIIAGHGRFGQIIARFLSGQGVKITILEKDPQQVELLRKFGFKGYFGDASRIDLLRSSGADKAKLLVVAVDDPDSCLEIVKLAKEEFPNLKIFARARNRRHAYELSKAGVEYFRRETFDASLVMAQEIMISLGYNPELMKHKAAAFLKHDEKTLIKSFEFFNREPELISFARQASGELERILRDDNYDIKDAV